MNRHGLFLVCLVLGSPALAQEPPRRAEVVESLRKATKFMHGQVARHGGYAWTSGVDGKLRNGEGGCGPDTIWVQPPGTPAVGLALLDAHEATGEALHLKAAEDAARALVKGQLRSGGWHYRIEFDPPARREFAYRAGAKLNLAALPKTPAPGGWDVWKQRQHKDDMTLLDDDTTPAALRLLMRVDRALGFKDREIHEAAEYGLTALLNAQYPIGAWSHNYDRFPTEPPSVEHYPVMAASVPKEWSRTWTKDFTGCYMLNDRITQNAIATLLLAWRIYGERKYRDAADRGGEFLLLAQLPAPQPAWAQQYDRKMQPVWDRKFEPPAVTGLESQDVLETLLLLHRETGDRKYLEPIPRAAAYLSKLRLADGTLARFYELKTDRPLYFTKDYRLTYSKVEAPAHYGFAHPSRL
ncbi:MAG: polysaccharide lyase, partial [Planctomycetia bacterium]|nr:polysaccharide lyase [Planctomycetia bacterium]